jgi:cob(I)alamin adenosyltransferase
MAKNNQKDHKTTEIIDGTRLLKSDSLIECLGTIDELCAFLGDVKVELGKNNKKSNYDFIENIQKDLIIISGVLAGSNAKIPDIYKLEDFIRENKIYYSSLSEFIIPGTNELNAKLHIARTVCRRTERRLVFLSNVFAESKSLNYSCFSVSIISELIAWFNRLSECLFLLLLL